MTKKDSTKNRPLLKFPEFNGVWQKRKIREIATYYSGLIGKTLADFGEGEPYITYKQINNSSSVDEQKFGFVKIKEGEKQNRVNYGDVLFVLSSRVWEESGLSSVYLGKVPVYLNSFSFGVSLDKNIIDPVFCKYLFRSPLVRRSIIRLARGSVRYNVLRGEILDLEISIPPLEEQKKISNFLNTLEKIITKLKKKEEILKVYKNKLCQDFFKGVV